MASISELQGAFGSLIDTLQNRLDPMRPEPDGSRWLGAIQRVSGLARDVNAWARLPDDDPAYDEPIGLLDAGTRSLAAAAGADGGAVGQALEAIEMALDVLERLLKKRHP